MGLNWKKIMNVKNVYTFLQENSKGTITFLCRQKPSLQNRKPKLGALFWTRTTNTAETELFFFKEKETDITYTKSEEKFLHHRMPPTIEIIQTTMFALDTI